jgi:SAM-dependent methyltransferase
VTEGEPTLDSKAPDAIPDYETYDFSSVWRGRGLADAAERRLVEGWALPGGDACLDLGGGFGRITKVLEPHFDRVFMLDYSKRNLLAAASRLSQKTTLVRSDLSSLPFHDDTFDFVSLVRVIHHVSDHEALLSEVVRVGRDGGTFVMSEANSITKALRRERGRVFKSSNGHIIYPSRLSLYRNRSLVREEIRGVGLFDNRISGKFQRLAPLSQFDVRTSRFWPAKMNLFIKFKISKSARRTRSRNEPHVLCVCGGEIVGNGCMRCDRRYGRVVDLVEARNRAGV